MRSRPTSTSSPLITDMPSRSRSVHRDPRPVARPAAHRSRPIRHPGVGHRRCLRQLGPGHRRAPQVRPGAGQGDNFPLSMWSNRWSSMPHATSRAWMTGLPRSPTGGAALDFDCPARDVPGHPPAVRGPATMLPILGQRGSGSAGRRPPPLRPRRRSGRGREPGGGAGRGRDGRAPGHGAGRVGGTVGTDGPPRPEPASARVTGGTVRRVGAVPVLAWKNAGSPAPGGSAARRMLHRDSPAPSDRNTPTSKG